MRSNAKTVNITDGRWRVVTWKYEGPNSIFIYLEHRCGKPNYGDHDHDPPPAGRWTHYAYRIKQIGPCCSCHEDPPDGIQAMFWFLWDHSSWWSQ